MKKIMDRTKKLLIGCVAAFAIYSLAGFFLVPYLVKTVVAGKLTEALHRNASFEKVYFNPYSFSLRVLGFKLMEPAADEVFASFGELTVNLQGRSLIKGGLTVKELILDKFYLRAVHNKDLSYNFTDLIPRQKSASEPEKEPLKFSFNNIRVTNGSVAFIDLPKNKTHAITDINASIPFISSIPSEVEIFVKPSFGATVNGAPFEFKGESKPFADSSETSLDIDFKGLNIPEYLAYSPVPLKFSMPSGTLSADLALSYVQFRDKGPELTLKGLMKFRGLEFQEADSSGIARFPAIDVDIAYVNAFARNAKISSIVLDRPVISIVRKKDGTINAMALVPSSGSPEQPQAPAVEEKPEEKKEGQQFTVEVDSLGSKKARLSFADLSRKPAFSIALEPIDISLKGFTTASGKKADLTFDYKNPSGEAITAKGSVSINPIEADVDLNVDSFDIRPVQPYIDDAVRIAVTKGRAAAKGTLSAGYADKLLRLSYRGGASLNGFSTIDKVHREELAGWSSLAIDGIEFDLSPRLVVVKSIVLSDFYTNITRGRDGKINLLEAVTMPGAKGTGAKGQQPSDKGATYMRIDSVSLKGGKVAFRDSFIEPAFALGLDGLSGRVKGLFLDGSKLADLNLAGKIDKYAPFEVTGKINPKKDELLVDMRVQLSGYDLSSMTPYSGRYIGYRIDKGKIFLDLGYLIDKRKLDARNDVLIDQITLGERVESPQATSLPVSFAISLLKDRRGQIKLDVPLSGSLDDPEFSVAHRRADNLQPH